MYFQEERHIEIQEASRDFFKKRFSTFEQEGNPNRISSLLSDLSSSGYSSANIPAEFGGTEYDLRSTLILIIEMAKVNPAFSHVLGSHLFGFNRPLSRFGNKEQKKRLFNDITQSKKWGTMSITEPDGANPQEIRCSAEYKGNEYILNGTKSMVTNARFCDFALVLARTGDVKDLISAFTLFIIPLKNNPQINISPPEDTIGVYDCHISEVSFQDCSVSTGDILGEEGSGLPNLMEIIHETRMANAAYSLGIAEAAILEAGKYAYHRKVKGAPLLQESIISQSFGKMYMELENLRFLFWGTLLNYESGKYNTPEDKLFHASLIKYQATESSIEISDRALQIHGGNGYIKDYNINRLYLGARLGKIIGGTSEVILGYISSMVSKNIFNNYSK